MGQDLREISLEAVQLGKAVERVDEELRRIAADVVSRPRVTDARTVTLKISIKPEQDPESGINIPHVDWSVGFSMPGHKGMTTRAFVDDDGRVKVNMNDPVGQQPQMPNLFDVQDVSSVQMAR